MKRSDREKVISEMRRRSFLQEYESRVKTARATPLQQNKGDLTAALYNEIMSALPTPQDAIDLGNLGIQSLASINPAFKGRFRKLAPDPVEIGKEMLKSSIEHPLATALTIGGGKAALKGYRETVPLSARTYLHNFLPRSPKLTYVRNKDLKTLKTAVENELLREQLMQEDNLVEINAHKKIVDQFIEEMDYSEYQDLKMTDKRGAELLNLIEDMLDKHYYYVSLRYQNIKKLMENEFPTERVIREVAPAAKRVSEELNIPKENLFPIRSGEASLGKFFLELDKKRRSKKGSIPIKKIVDEYKWYPDLYQSDVGGFKRFDLLKNQKNPYSGILEDLKEIKNIVINKYKLSKVKTYSGKYKYPIKDVLDDTISKIRQIPETNESALAYLQRNRPGYLVDIDLMNPQRSNLIDRLMMEKGVLEQANKDAERLRKRKRKIK